MRHHHLSDRDLVLALDGELPVRHQAVVEAHLTECPSCQTRRTQLHQGAELATAIYRSASPDSDGIAASREALRLKLANLGREQSSFIDRVVPSFAGISRWAVVGAAAVAVILLARVMQQSDIRPHGGAPIENGTLPIASLTTATFGALGVSCSVIPRPRRIRVPIVAKYSGETAFRSN